MIRLMILKPTVVFAAQVNQPGGFGYPIAEVGWDSATTGAYTSIKPGQTVTFGSTPGGRDWGRQRIRKAATADTLYFGRSSGGGRPGEVALQDNAYITVYDDYRLWLKMQRIDPSGLIFKDADIAYVDQTIEPPPVAVFESAFAGTVNGSGIITVSFDAADSFAVSSGDSISSHLWDVGDGVIVTGTATSAQITATFPPGARYVGLTVEDSNGNSHTTHRLVYAYEEGDDHNVELFKMGRHDIEHQGQQVSVHLYQDLDTADYPDGTAVLVWDGEPLSPADRSNLLFQGWLDTEPVHVGAGRTGFLRDTTLELVDVGGMLRQLGGRPEYVENVEVPTKWTQMKGVTIDAFHHYLLHWHSTALEVTSYLDPAIGSDYAMISLGSDAGTLWEQVDGLCRKLTPDHYFTCDSFGVLRTVDDSMLQDIPNRIATVQRALTEDDYTDIRFTYRPLPRYTITREGAIKPDASYVEDLPEDYELTTFFCIAPGEAWGQGPAEWERNEGIARSQSDLNSCAGHRYARLNAPYTEFEIDLSADMHPAIEPAHLTWVTLTFSPQYAAQRGFSFTAARGMPKRVTIRYENPDGTPVRSATLTWELETVGLPAITEVINVGADLPDNSFWGPGYEETNFVTVTVPPQLLSDTGLYIGQNNVVLIGESGRVYRTANFQDASPTWALVTPSPAPGAIDSFVVDPFSPGYRGTGTAINGWFARSPGQTDGIWRVTDLFGTPSGALQHTFPHANTQNSVFRAIHASFGRYFENEIENPWLICLSHYVDDVDQPGTWATYSKDAGVTWAAEVQLSPHYDSSSLNRLEFPQLSVYASPKTPGLAYATAYIETVGDSFAGGFITTDWGATWSALSDPDIQPGQRHAGAIHVPWPDNADEKLVYHGSIEYNAPIEHRLKRVNGTTITDVSPGDGTRFYGAGSHYHSRKHMPFGVRTYDNDRRYVAVAGFGNDNTNSISGGFSSAFVSSNHGDSWTQITTPVDWNSKAPLQVAFAGDSPNVLFLWGQVGYIGYSDDFGATIQDKAGNMESIRGAGDEFIGIAGGLT